MIPYRVIRLPNGLTACLISDVANITIIPTEDKSDRDSESDSETYTEDEATASEAEEEKPDNEDEEIDSKQKKTANVEEKMVITIQGYVLHYISNINFRQQLDSA